MRAGDLLALRMVRKFQVPPAAGAGHFHIHHLLQGDDRPAVRTRDLPAKEVGGKFNVPAACGAGNFEKTGVNSSDDN
jgi:hypothetical protein